MGGTLGLVGHGRGTDSVDRSGESMVSGGNQPWRFDCGDSHEGGVGDRAMGDLTVSR